MLNQATVRAGVDRQLPERLAEVTFAGAGRPADAQVLVPVDPFQGVQRSLGVGGDGAAGVIEIKGARQLSAAAGLGRGNAGQRPAHH